MNASLHCSTVASLPHAPLWPHLRTPRANRSFFRQQARSSQPAVRLHLTRPACPRASADSPATAPGAAAVAASQGDARAFFEPDVVRYGDRYNRPDRFPRLRAADARQRQVDVRDWLARLRDSARGVFVWDEGDAGEPAGPRGAEGGDGRGEGEEAGEDAAQFRLLVLQGRLEDAYEVAKAAFQRQSAAFGFSPAMLLAPASTISPRRADHAALLLAALSAGNVELAFEYAGLLPPRRAATSETAAAAPLPAASVAVYNLLLAGYVVAGDGDAMRLAVATARRRGLAPDGLTYALMAAADVAWGAERAPSARWFDEAVAAGAVRGGKTREDALAACAVPFS